eukprot:tig00000767_g3972.t1
MRTRDAGAPPSGGTCTVSPLSVQAGVEKVTVTCSGWQSASRPLRYTVTSDLAAAPLALDVLSVTIVFFFPDSGATRTATLSVAVEDGAGRATAFAIAAAVEVKALVPATGNAVTDFNAAVDAVNKEVTAILNSSDDFATKMNKILALVGTLKDRYSKATGVQLRRLRRAVLGAIDSLLASFSTVISNVMTAVTTEATKSGVDLTNTANAGALVTFFSSVAPVAAKTGAVSEATAVQGATLLMNVIKANPNLATTAGIDAKSLQTSLSGLLSAIPATSTAAASIRAETQTALTQVAAQATRATEFDPWGFKACPSAGSRVTVGGISDAPGAVITFPTNAWGGKNFQALVRVYANASSFPAPPAGFRLVAPILDVTATGLDDAGRAKQLSSEFSSGVGFTIPVASGVTVAAGQAVSLVFFNATSKAWEVCSAATAAAGAYTATCNHLTPFSLMSTARIPGSTSNAYVDLDVPPAAPPPRPASRAAVPPGEPRRRPQASAPPGEPRRRPARRAAARRASAPIGEPRRRPLRLRPDRRAAPPPAAPPPRPASRAAARHASALPGEPRRRPPRLRPARRAAPPAAAPPPRPASLGAAPPPAGRRASAPPAAGEPAAARRACSPVMPC